MDDREVPLARLLQGDEIDDNYCADCLRPATEWPRLASYHPVSRPGAIIDAELYCADCKPRAYNDAGREVRTFCGQRHSAADPVGINCGCFA